METTAQTQTPKDIARQWFVEVWGLRDASAIYRLSTPELKGYLEGSAEIVTREDFAVFHRTLLTVFPDLKVEVVAVLGDDRLACVRWKASGTHLGDGMGFKATQKPVIFEGSSWLVVENGKVIEGKDTWNQGLLFASLAGA